MFLIPKETQLKPALPEALLLGLGGGPLDTPGFLGRLAGGQGELSQLVIGEGGVVPLFGGRLIGSLGNGLRLAVEHGQL